MKLITEYTQNQLSYSISEAKNGTKQTFLEGVFMQAENKNKNGRIYTREVLTKAVDKFVNEQVITGSEVGELNHPDGPSINLDKVSHRITELQWDGNNVMGKALILDTPMGQIVKGLVEYKGRMHVHFGEPVTTEFDNADQLAAEVDRQILSHYRLFPSHIIAWQMQGNKDKTVLATLKQQWPNENWLEAETRFQSQVATIPSIHRQIAIDAYAAPVDNQLAQQTQSQES